MLSIRTFVVGVILLFVGWACDDNDQPQMVEPQAEDQPNPDVSASENGNPVAESEQVSETDTDVEGTGNSDDNLQEDIVEAPLDCDLQENAVQNIQRMEDVVDIINALPKPLSLPCLLKHLPRPIPINANASSISAQPVEDEDSPRIFMIYQDLFLSVVPEGEGRHLLEFSHLLNARTSVKGELSFPITENLEREDPYLDVFSEGKSFSRCAGCHLDETAAPSEFPVGSIQSFSFKPNPRFNVSLTFLEYYLGKCEENDDFRCSMLRSLLSGETIEAEFPEAMRTMF